MKTLATVGIIFTAIGAFWLIQALSAIHRYKKPGVGVVVGGIIPFGLLGALGVLLLIAAAVVRMRRG